MSEIEQFVNIIKLLRSENGCPWDREQTHSSLKAACIEEAAEVVCGINIFEKRATAIISKRSWAISFCRS